MNLVEKASVNQGKTSKLSFAEGCMMAAAMITALSLQAHTQSPNHQQSVSHEYNLSSSSVCQVSHLLTPFQQ